MGTPEKSSAIPRVIAVVAVLILVFLHNDYWHAEPQHEAVAGGFPRDMAYHLAWVVVATGVLWWVMRVTWKTRE